MKKRYLITFVSLTLLAAAVIMRFTRYYGLACADYATVGIKSDVAEKINGAFSNVLKSQSGNKAIVNVTRDGGNRIISIEYDAEQINRITIETAQAVNEIINGNETTYSLPLFNALGFKMLAGKGPGIPVRLNALGTAVCEAESEFVSAGINQTLHRICVRYSVLFKCIAPFDEETVCLTGSLVLCETLIVGEVPEILLTPDLRGDLK